MKLSLIRHINFLRHIFFTIYDANAVHSEQAIHHYRFYQKQLFISDTASVGLDSVQSFAAGRVDGSCAGPCRH